MRRPVTTLLSSCLFLFLCLSFADESLSGHEASLGEEEPAKEALLSYGPWDLDAGGQVRVRGDFARNQNLTDFTFSSGERRYFLSKGLSEPKRCPSCRQKRRMTLVPEVQR